MICHACGAALTPTARFCHKCGAAVSAASQGSAGWQAGLRWAVAGAAVGALLPVLVVGGGGGRGGGGGPHRGTEGTPPPPPLPPPAILQISPGGQAPAPLYRPRGPPPRGA